MASKPGYQPRGGKRPAPPRSGSGVQLMSPPVIRKPTLGPVEIIEDVEQQSPEWLQLRLGIPTASNFSIIMADGRDGEASKTRAKYMRQLAGEIMTGRPAEGKIKTAAMQRGNDMEPEARDYYARTAFTEVRRVDFIRRRLPSGRYAGASPDGLIGPRKALEIKTMAPDALIERLEKGAGMPPEHRAQVHGTMWLGDLEEVDLLLFYSGMPVNPRFTVVRDEAFIKEISNAVEIFDHETNKLVQKIKAMGGIR